MVELRSTEKEIRPLAKEADSEKITGGRSGLILANLSADQWDLWLDGYRAGYLQGIPVGREQERCEVAALQVCAARIVHAMADIPARDVEVDQRAAAKRAGYWAERRGEAV